MLSGDYMELEIKELKKSFGDKVVLKDINYKFEKGKIYGLLGRNGAGKTTFFNCLAEEIKKDSGEIKVDGEDLKVEDIGYVLSTPVVPEFLTGREFLKFFIEVNQDKIKDFKEIDEYFNFLKIKEEDRDRIMKEYSHGMKSKMQMIINIMSKPKVLLLDEPLTSFDVVMAEEMKKMIKEIKKDHIIIFSTHILELATDLCDEIVILNNGVLSDIDNNELNNLDFKNKIIDALKGDSND